MIYFSPQKEGCVDKIKNPPRLFACYTNSTTCSYSSDLQNLLYSDDLNSNLIVNIILICNKNIILDYSIKIGSPESY